MDTESPETRYMPDPALPWASRVILRVEVGSTAHGTGSTDTEDYDEIGIMTLPIEQTIGIPVRSERHETIIYRPGRAEGERSQAGDYDLSVHSVRKFCRLAAEGNPSILMVLFGPVRYATPLGEQLIGMRDAFWHQGAKAKFLGYMRAQRERLEGVRGGKHTNRPELIDLHGYDTKYAMHMLRLGIQGKEYMAGGHITMPMHEEERQYLRDVRNGEIPYAEVIDYANELEFLLLALESPAPVRPDFERINTWLLRCFMNDFLTR